MPTRPAARASLFACKASNASRGEVVIGRLVFEALRAISAAEGGVGIRSAAVSV
jgi:hypothetical protein